MSATPRFIGPLAIAILALLLAPTALASDTPSGLPVAAPTPERLVDGYDWEARLHSRHLVRNALDWASMIDLGDIATPVIDLELRQLMPVRTYSLSNGARSIPVYANSAGEGIAWNLPAEPGEWVLFDGRSGEPVTTITLLPAVDFAPAALEPVPAESECRWYQWWCEPTYQPPPQPVSSETFTSGMVVEQAAYSFTENAIVVIETCWDHSITVTAKVSGGVAGNGASAGGDYTYSRRECLEFRSQGKAVEFRRENHFRKDTYEDGSYKIYSAGPGRTYSVVTVEGVAPVPDDARIYKLGALRGEVVLRFNEGDAGSAWYEEGVNVFGAGLGVRVTGSASAGADVAIHLLPPSAGTRTFAVHILNWDAAHRGIIGMVWEV